MEKQKSEKWVKISNSHAEVAEADIEYYLKKTSEEKLSELQELREIQGKLSSGEMNENRKGLRRIITVVKKT